MLAKLERICQVCETQYILVATKENLLQASCCPFCTMPTEEVDLPKEEDAE